MLVLVLLVTHVFAASNNGYKEHTETFSTFTESLFLRSTYITSDPCRSIKDRKEFIEVLSEYGISMDYGGYDMEHIVDNKNTPYEGNKSILGNLVMANSSWNRQLGWLNWTMVAREKSVVYGDIFDQAVDAVVSCNDDMTDIIAIILLSIIVTMIILLLIVSIYFVNRENMKLCSHLANTNEVSVNVENRV